MAHPVEPMEIDSSVCDFDDKENAFHHNNVHAKTPCTEKGYEELDVSELNMKLRYSVTPAASPMSKSYENQNYETENIDVVNGNMTRSLHTTLTKNDTFNKSQKTLPLQSLLTDHGQVSDGNRNVLQPLDSTLTVEKNIIVTVSGPHDDDTSSLPSSTSSIIHTPEATTPTKEIPKGEGSSPIIRGLKSVLNMFRPSQSPIPVEDDAAKLETLSPPIVNSPDTSTENKQTVSASTPLTGQKTKVPLTKQNSDKSLVFNEDFEKELEWKDDSTILFSNEKIPIHKLFYHQPNTTNQNNLNNSTMQIEGVDLNVTVEYMDISNNDPGIMDKTVTKLPSDLNKSVATNPESDGDFEDCESNFTKDESFKSQDCSELNSTEDVLTHINHLVQGKCSASLETLNASGEKSANFSNVSTETTKPLNISSELLLPTTVIQAIPEKKNTQQDTEDEKKEEILKVLQADEAVSIESDPNNTTQVIDLIPNVTTSSNSFESNYVVNNAPALDNVCVKSLSQIPLIIDPRVLLFSIPDSTESVINSKDVKGKDVSYTSPADIPLPEDDDMLSLPAMNNELELDIIADEIPKINQHESSVSSVDSLSENKLVETPTENIILPEAQHTEILTGKATDSKNAELETLVELKVDTSASKDDNNGLEHCEINNPTESDSVFFVNTDFKSDNDGITLPTQTSESNKFALSDTFNVNSDIAIDLPNKVKNMALQEAIPEESLAFLNPTEIRNDSMTKDDEVAIDCHARQITNISPSTKICQENISQNSIELWGRPMDISVTELDILLNTVKTQKADENFDCSFKLAAVDNNDFQDLTEAKQNYKTETADQAKHIPSKMSESNIDFIKKEIETIFRKAIVIAAAKSNAQNDEGINKNSEFIQIENNTTIITNSTANGIQIEANMDGSNLIQTEVEVQYIAEQTKSEIVALNESAITALDNVTNVQELPLKHPSDDKFDCTVQDYIAPTSNDNILPHLSTEEMKVKDSENHFVEVKEIVRDIEKNVPEEINTVDQQSAVVNEDTIINVSHIDTEKKETTDYEVSASENNIPFVMVPNEIEVDVKVTESIEGIENISVTCSKVVKTPPSSPKIVSKGYNFNFDDIDDPFGTKIKMSPALDASPNKTLDQICDEKELTKETTANNNRRKLQPERKKPAVTNRKLNSTFTGKFNSKANPIDAAVKAVTPKLQSCKSDSDYESLTSDLKLSTKNDTNMLEKAVTISETSSLDQSTYFSAGTSSNKANKNKSNFNVPDLDDTHLNPFVSKSKIRQSPPPEHSISPFATRSRICLTPPPNLECEDPFAIKCNIRNSPEPSSTILEVAEKPTVSTYIDERHIQPHIYDRMNKTEISLFNTVTNCGTTSKDTQTNQSATTVVHLEDKESSENISGTTCSSNNDKVNTEDEDTIEGPFLEAENLQNDDKISDFGSEKIDIMQFSELPATNPENPDGGELFIDAEAFEFLLNQNQDHVVSDSGKESLFLKFDPLFLKRLSSDGVMASLKQVQAPAKQSTPIKDEQLTSPKDVTFDKSPVMTHDAFLKKPPIPGDVTFDIPAILNDANFDKSSPIAGPSGLNTTQNLDFNDTAEESYEDVNVTVTKPMMVVNPAVNPVVTPRNKTVTPVRSNRQSLTFTSPAIAVIDRLISMSANNSSLMSHDATVTEILRDNEANLAQTQLRELLADKEISVYNLRSATKELQNRLATLESQVKTLENISADRLKKINELNDTLNDKTKVNRKMAQVVEEYERTIASLIAETEQDKKRHAEERLQLIKERDEQTAHLASMEVSFCDLHSKYEKSKQMILAFKETEDAIMKKEIESKENLTKIKNNFEQLKQHATAKLNHANEELQKINRAHEAEILKMGAMIKRKELHINSLEETLQQKTKANEELTAICDELINKVG